MLKIGVESNRRWIHKLALDIAKMQNSIHILIIAKPSFADIC